MTPRKARPRITRPGSLLHIAFVASVLIYALVVERYPAIRGMGSSDELGPVVGNLGVLRAVFALVGLTDVGAILVFLWRPRLVGSVSVAFLLAYIGLEALAVYGLVLFLLGGSRTDFYLFAGPSFVGLVSLYVQQGRWDAWTAREARRPKETGGEYG